MELIKSIQLISTFIWVFVPIRQFRTRFFLFFLVLGLMDIVYFLLILSVRINSLSYYSIGIIILLYSALINVKQNNRIIVTAISMSIGIVIILMLPSQALIFQMAIHLIIFIFFIKILVVYFSENRKLLLFHIMLVIYEFSLLLKFFVYYQEVGVGPVYYSVTTTIEVIIGISFLFINELNSPKLTV